MEKKSRKATSASRQLKKQQAIEEKEQAQQSSEPTIEPSTNSSSDPLSQEAKVFKIEPSHPSLVECHSVFQDEQELFYGNDISSVLLQSLLHKLYDHDFVHHLYTTILAERRIPFSILFSNSLKLLDKLIDQHVGASQSNVILLRDRLSNFVMFEFSCFLRMLLSEILLLPQPTFRMVALFLLHHFSLRIDLNSVFVDTLLQYKNRSFVDKKQHAIYSSPSLDISAHESWVAKKLLSHPNVIHDLCCDDIYHLDVLLQEEDVPVVSSFIQLTTPHIQLVQESHEPSPPPTVDEALELIHALFGSKGPLFGLADKMTMTCRDFALEILWPSSPLVMPCFQFDTHHHIKEIQQLVFQAHHQALSADQQQSILGFLSCHPQAMHHLVLEKKLLAQLIEYNPLLATECFQHLVHTPQWKEYLNELLAIHLSLPSMEVVNRLAMAHTQHIPPTFITCYILNCIRYCQEIQDRYLQNRQVRLVCVFLQSLVQKSISVQNVSREIEAFCQEFDRIKEANTLARILKKQSQ